MYNWKLLRNKRTYKCKCWMTDDCAPCPEPPWTWRCYQERTKLEESPQQVFLHDHDGNFIGMFHPYE